MTHDYYLLGDKRLYMINERNERSRKEKEIILQHLSISTWRRILDESMLAIFVLFFFCLGTNAHEDATSISTTTDLSFNEEAELTKIAESCFTTTNFEQLSGNIVRGTAAQIVAIALIYETVTVIGLAEMRRALNLRPLPPWTHYKKPTYSELASSLSAAPTIQAYYDLKEPSSDRRSLDSDYLTEQNLKDGIAYMDNRFPSIRQIYRRRFKKIRESFGKVINRKAVDRMIDGFKAAFRRVYSAVREMTPGRDIECWVRDRRWNIGN